MQGAGAKTAVLANYGCSNANGLLRELRIGETFFYSFSAVLSVRRKIAAERSCLFFGIFEAGKSDVRLYLVIRREKQKNPCYFFFYFFRLFFIPLASKAMTFRRYPMLFHVHYDAFPARTHSFSYSLNIMRSSKTFSFFLFPFFPLCNDNPFREKCPRN